MRAAWSLAVFAVAPLGLLLLGGACSEETIVLATIPASDAGGGRAVVRCSSPSDCAAGLFCDKHQCDEAVGVCEAYPAYCSDELHPVCGCDGITYYNDCLRHVAGVTRASEGECAAGSATPCGGTAGACPSGTVCVRLLGAGVDPRRCPDDVGGTCWGTPASCPATSTTPDRWNGCGPDGDRCVDTCTALTSGVPHVRASGCP
jgi:hypothetical protein